jgi:hypothetical protein
MPLGWGRWHVDQPAGASHTYFTPPWLRGLPSRRRNDLRHGLEQSIRQLAQKIAKDPHRNGCRPGSGQGGASVQAWTVRLQLLIPTKPVLGRVTASHIASASFFCRYTYGFTYRGGEEPSTASSADVGPTRLGEFLASQTAQPSLRISQNKTAPEGVVFATDFFARLFAAFWGGAWRPHLPGQR